MKLSPAAMEATHDIDFVLWCLAPRKPIRVYAQEVHKIMKGQYNVPDCVWIVVTMDDGTAFTIGAGWVLPPAYPNFSSTWIEFVGTEGAVMVDDTHRDVYTTTLQKGIQFPISSMPGEKVNHVYAGPMEAETLHFLECVALGKQPLVTGEQARLVMQVYQAADLSAETGQPVELCQPCESEAGTVASPKRLKTSIDRGYSSHGRDGTCCRSGARGVQTHQNPLVDSVSDQPDVSDLLHGPQQHFGGPAGNREAIRAEQDARWVWF